MDIYFFNYTSIRIGENDYDLKIAIVKKTIVFLKELIRIIVHRLKGMLH